MGIVDKIETLWEKLQNEEWGRYKKSPIGVFSIDGLRGAGILGKVVTKKLLINSKCLDIGCGALPKPFYMKVASDIQFTGIDPYEGDVNRDFEFIQGYAENLPFDNESFDGVVFATSFDHVTNPYKAIEEAHRVLKKNGFLFVWGSIVPNNRQYRTWKANFPTQYNDHHLWAYTKRSLNLMIKPYFKKLEMISLSKRVKIFIFKKR